MYHARVPTMNINLDSITAIVTGRGLDSTVPDRAGVDATIYFDGKEAGEVTLLPDDQGSLSTWGCPDNWASSALQAWIDTVAFDTTAANAAFEADEEYDAPDAGDVHAAIVAAVEEAAK